MIKHPLRIGIIGGTGRCAQIDIRNLQLYQYLYPQTIQIQQICSRFPHKIKSLYNLDVEVVDSIQKITHNHSIDIVINASNTDLHYQINKSALLNHKHLYTHKPGSETLDQLRELNDIYQSKKQQLKTGVCYQRRYAHNYVKMHQKLKQNSLGQLETIHLISRDKFKPNPEFLKNNDKGRDGIFVDFSCHDIDLVRYISGLEFSKVYAEADNLYMHENPQSSDTAMIQFRLNNGAMGNIVLGRRNTYGYDQRVELFAEKGLLKIKHNKKDNDLQEWTDQGIVCEQGLQDFISYYASEFKDSLFDFLDSIVHDKQHKASIEDAYQAFRVVKACQLSLESGQSVLLEDVK